MALTISGYRGPGTFSQILDQPTAPSTNGIPVVGIVGPAIQGSYTPLLFDNFTSAQNEYGNATRGNPLALGCQFAFNNGAPTVLGLNVLPDNSTAASLLVPISSLPTTVYSAAPSGTIDVVTQAPVNPDGTIAGAFYIQDFNPLIADPTYSTTQAIQAAFANAGSNSMLQYVQLLGATFIPIANSNLTKIIVYKVQQSAPPTVSSGTAITQTQWNQYSNALALQQAFFGYQSPVEAQLLIPDSGATGQNPIPGYIPLVTAVGKTVNSNTSSPITFTNINQVYQYALQSGGVLYIYATTPGPQDQVILGLFDSNLASSSSTNGQAFGLPVITNNSNPYEQLALGTSGVITTTSYINAINQLTQYHVDFLCVLNTDPALLQVIKAHVQTVSDQYHRNECRALLSGPISELSSTSISNAQSLQGGPAARRVSYIFPTYYYFDDPVLGATVPLDGSYMACAIAGVGAANKASEPLIHKTINGFRDVGVNLDQLTADSIADNGILIIENDPRFGIRVRDGLTCDPTSPDTQNISVVYALDYAVQSLRDAMDDSIIGTAIIKSTIGNVQSLATSVLNNLVENNIINDFQNVIARINPNDPTRIDVTAGIKPAYPCKYIYITVQVYSS